MSWQNWSVSTWNEKLLPYFFGTYPDTPDEPISRLVVTSEELAQVTGDPAARPDEVREAFVAAMQKQLRRARRSLCADATDYGDNTGRWSPNDETEWPPFVAHLILTCLAASDCSEEIADESVFQRRLDFLCGDHVASHPPTCFNQLWEDLAAWLRNARRADEPFRELLLPDPGRLTRIGYTVNLSFPHRYDQRRLTTLLAEQRLSGTEPPVASILKLLRGNLRSFSPRFQKTFLEFQETYERGGERLDRHPLWRAVRDAALWAKPVTEAREVETRFHLLMDIPPDGHFAPFIVTDLPLAGSTSKRLRARVAEYDFGPYRYLVEAIEGGADTDKLDSAVRLLLTGQLDLPRLSPLVRQGVLLFARDQNGLYSLTSARTDLDDVCALVRDDLVREVIRFFGRPGLGRAGQSASSFEGWTEVWGLLVRPLRQTELQDSPLSEVWSVQETITPPQIRLTAGVQADGGYLGLSGVLPVVTIGNADEVVIESSGERCGLQQNAEDRTKWHFPARDFQGFYKIAAHREGAQLAEKEVRFYGTVALENYKGPSTAGNWMRESGTSDIVQLQAEDLGPADMTTDERADFDFFDFVRGGLYLGAGVGDVSPVPLPGYAWVVYHQPGSDTPRLMFRGDPAKGSVPERRVGHPRAARIWRRLMTSAPLVGQDPRVVEIRRAYAELARVRDGLPRSPEALPPELPASSLPSGITPKTQVHELETILAALAISKQGIDQNDLRDLMRRVLKIDDWRSLWDVVRAWSENGCFDQLLNMRWRNTRYFAIPPVLVMYRAGHRVQAALCGLATEATRTRLRREAERLGIAVQPRQSVSALVPSLLAFEAPSDEVFFELAKAAASRRPKWLRSVDQSIVPIAAVKRPPGRAPLNYRLRGRWDWHRAYFADPDRPGDSEGVSLEWYWRSDSPDYYAIVKNNSLVWWTHSRNWALLVGHAERGEDPFVEEGTHQLRRTSESAAYLPLTVGRLTAILGPLGPGPVSAGSSPSYVYTFPTSFLRRLIRRRLRAQDGVQPFDGSQRAGVSHDA